MGVGPFPEKRSQSSASRRSRSAQSVASGSGSGRSCSRWEKRTQSRARSTTFLLHPSFPVDIRHNAKIFREKLARWAEGRAVVKALVTGGGGFLGGAIVRRLIERGDSVRSLSRGDYPDLRALGVETIRGDVADRDATLHAADRLRRRFPRRGKGGDLGTSGRVRPGQRRRDSQRRRGLPSFMGWASWSSPARLAWFTAAATSKGWTSRPPIPTTLTPFIPRPRPRPSGSSWVRTEPNLATVALRPHLIWGPGDNHLIPRIIARAKAGRLRRIGNRLEPGRLDLHRQRGRRPPARRRPPRARLEPRRSGVFSLARRPLAALGPDQRYPPRREAAEGHEIRLPQARPARRRVDGVDPSRPPASGEPLMTRFLVDQLCTAHWFNIEAARRDLGYEPTVSIVEGLKRLARWFDELRPR